ncbi:glycosyl hydrolase 108 family protein [Phnomibacter sp. MR]|uniref:glycosyl hydrolase 108 family protein n=1 Tax=Phnomibacter sp. MR TaxID=3042318 RepID=UPI003A7FA369
MSANYQQSKSMLMPIEGGYAFPNNRKAGETYRGIDRRYHPTWKGWPLIDAFKRNNKIRAGQIINDAAIEAAVVDFYQKYWAQHGLQHIVHPTIAAMLFAFVVHEQYRAIRIINAVAAKLGEKKTNQYKITPEVAATLEKNDVAGYRLLRAAITAHYNNMTSDPNRASYIRNRVNVFPPTIVSAKKKSSFSWWPW